MPKFRKRSPVVEAEEFHQTGTLPVGVHVSRSPLGRDQKPPAPDRYYVVGPAGVIQDCRPGDWIVTVPDGRGEAHLAVGAVQFANEYERVEGV